MKKQVKLTQSDLYNVIKESVKNIVLEFGEKNPKVREYRAKKSAEDLKKGDASTYETSVKSIRDCGANKETMSDFQNKFENEAIKEVTEFDKMKMYGTDYDEDFDDELNSQPANNLAAEGRKAFRVNNESKNINMKQTIRLTESDLHKIIKESVNRILNEIGDSFEKPVEQGGLGLPKGAGKPYLAKKASKEASTKNRMNQSQNFNDYYQDSFNQNFGMPGEGFRMTHGGTVELGNEHYPLSNDVVGRSADAQKRADTYRNNVRLKANTMKAYPRMKINKGLDAYDSIHNALIDKQ